jgi:23S rRNA (pseudouridine1915-N3)-methyltransferase
MAVPSIAPAHGHPRRAIVKTILLTVGKARPPFADADAHYRKLLSRHQPVEVVEVRSEADLMRRLPDGAHVVAFDADGVQRDSTAFAAWLDERRLAARDVCFLIGGREGLAADVLGAAEERISFGPQTMAHQLARVVLLEQLFRAAKILAGEPYHH